MEESEVTIEGEYVSKEDMLNGWGWSATLDYLFCSLTTFCGHMHVYEYYPKL